MLGKEKKMRLSEETILILKKTISKYIKNPKIILFGSRVDDNKKGGDIDILVQTNENVDIQKQIEILTMCEINGIERKIDMLFQTPHSKEQNIFQTAIKEGVVL